MARLLDRLLGRQRSEPNHEGHTPEQHFDHMLDDIGHQRAETCHHIGGECGEAERRSKREVNRTFDGISTAL